VNDDAEHDVVVGLTNEVDLLHTQEPTGNLGVLRIEVRDLHQSTTVVVGLCSPVALGLMQRHPCRHDPGIQGELLGSLELLLMLQAALRVVQPLGVADVRVVLLQNVREDVPVKPGDLVSRESDLLHVLRLVRADGLGQVDLGDKVLDLGHRLVHADTESADTHQHCDRSRSTTAEVRRRSHVAHVGPEAAPVRPQNGRPDPTEDLVHVVHFAILLSGLGLSLTIERPNITQKCHFVNEYQRIPPYS